MNPTIVNVDMKSFWDDPYPVLEHMRRETPICFCPQMNAILLTKRNDIFACEKKIDVFSSEQPGGLMTVLMGANMMRKNGEPHLAERKQAFPTLSPRTVRNVWTSHFEVETRRVIETLRGKSTCDLVTDYAMPVAANALRHITGLKNLSAQQMDTVSQHMIDGISNYGGEPAIQSRCEAATALIDDAIDDMLPTVTKSPNMSLLSILTQAGQADESVRANIKLAISGGQNEPRDAIAGTAWALLSHPDQLELVKGDSDLWLKSFEEYARWVSPIGMSPREIAQDFEWDGAAFENGQRAFFMFSSGNRDEAIFERPEEFDIERDTTKSISFGAGPHFCAGAAASRVLIGQIALPRLFEAFPEISLAGETKFGGWAFRGPLSVPVKLVYFDCSN
jgi:cytochrome P450